MTDILTSTQFKAARLAMDMTQKQMAEWLYTSDRRIRAWEKGEAAIPGGVRRCIDLANQIGTRMIKINTII